MKNAIILIGMLVSASCSNAQKISEKAVPAAVKATFQQQYPNAKKIKWEEENGNYEAGFETANADQSVLIDASGAILETEVEIKVAELPANAKAYITKNFANQKIKEAAQITDSKGVLTFEAEVKGKDLIFDNNGNFIKAIKN